MTITTTAEISQLIQEGQAAADTGDTFTARERFRRATEIEPDSAEAWIALSTTVPVLAEKRDHLRRALRLAPTHPQAQAELADVERLLAEGHQLAPIATLVAQPAGDNRAPAMSSPPTPARCYRHSGCETGLHCIQCDRPICGECAEVTPVGQLCPDCRLARRPRNYQISLANLGAGWLAGLIGAAAGALVVVLVISPLPLFGLFLTLLAGPFSGGLIVGLSDRLTHAKRGRPMQFAVGVGIGLGGLPLLLLLAAPTLPTLLLGGYLALALSSAALRLR